MSNNIFGLNIVEHNLAIERIKKWKVEAMPIKKKRRNWRVVMSIIEKPSAYQLGNTIYAHHDIIDKLKTYLTGKG